MVVMPVIFGDGGVVGRVLRFFVDGSGSAAWCWWCMVVAGSAGAW